MTTAETKAYVYKPKLVEEIVVREFNFEFPSDLNPLWVPDNPVRSHFFNGISLTMPYLEPYMVKTNHGLLSEIKHPTLLEDIKRFNAQESAHFRCHRRINELLKTNGYPVFAQVEQVIKRHYQRLSERKLITKLAYSAGFETMTKGFSVWITAKRRNLWKGADNNMTSFWLMHLTEEAEHKTVAFDVYMTMYGNKYLPRALGVLHGSFGVVGLAFLGMLAAMKEDRTILNPINWWRFCSLIGSLLWNVGPYLLHAMLPWHDPRNMKDSDWIIEWIEGYKSLGEGKPIPLVDTDHPDIPVPFDDIKT